MDGYQSLRTQSHHKKPQQSFHFGGVSIESIVP